MPIALNLEGFLLLWRRYNDASLRRLHAPSRSLAKAI